MRKTNAQLSEKTTFQLRYKPDLKFYDLLMSAASQLEIFPHWVTDRLRVQLHDYETHCSVAIQHDSITYNQDSKAHTLEKDRIAHIVELLPPALNIKDFVRFGYRKHYLIPVEMSFETLVGILDIKLFSQQDRLKSILPGRIDDLMYRSNFAKDDDKYHLTIGPVTQKEIPQHIPIDIVYHFDPKTAQLDHQKIIKDYPEVAIFMDIDFFIMPPEGLSGDALKDFVVRAPTEIQKLVDSLSAYLLETKLEH